MKNLLVLFLLISTVSAYAQSRKPRLIKKTFAISLVPGMGTFGILPGAYQSNFSLNLLGGYSYANRGLELSLISSANVADTRGIQVSGIGNITGINFQLSPFTDESGEANLTGIQVAGIANWVRDYIHGVQIAGVFNRARNMFGGQVGGINRLTGFGIGNQTGIYNWTQGSFDGVQLGGLINETGSRLVGLQLAPLNIAGSIEGRNSDPDRMYTALQLGLLNLSGDMHGFQIGLVNIGKKMRGTQIGLINISTEGGVPVNKRNGTMIGLVNIGNFHSIGFTAGELFQYNFSIETGTMKNGSVRGERTNRYVTSSLEYGFSSWHGDDYQRQYGVGLHKYYYNRTLTPGMNEKRFARGSAGLYYLQTGNEKFSGENFYAQLGAGGGYRLINKLSLYLTAYVSLNYAWAGVDAADLPVGAFGSGNGLFWPGGKVGLAVH